MLGELDDYFPLCEPLIKNIENKKIIAAVSHTLILEVLDTMRKKYLKELTFQGILEKNVVQKNFMLKKKCLNFIKTLDEFLTSRKVSMIDLDYPTSEYHDLLLKKFQNYFGYIRVMSMCPNCRSIVSRDSRKCSKCGKTINSIKKMYRYKGLGYVDLEHAYMAKHGNVSVFYTSDTSFRSLNNDPYFRPIEFKIIPHPSKL